MPLSVTMPGMPGNGSGLNDSFNVMPRSTDYYSRALRVTPGGVHSPVRSGAAVKSPPVFVESAKGATICDADGIKYTDYCMAFGPLILGHNHPDVASAVHNAIDLGWSYGTAERWSLELAELINARIPWAEQVRFVNSGTEAVMSALRLARAATGRDRIIKFAGCYHGHSDAMLIAAGSGMSGIPASAGVTRATATETTILPLDDHDALAAAFTAKAADIAAVIIEPLPANQGLQPQSVEFLQSLAAICREHGTLLIFDEVISGFRCGFDGLAGQTGIQPDLVTWGKIIGGGFPVGAFAGRRELMQQIAPAGDVYQAGTLSANPVAMRAGLATLQLLADGSVYRQLDELGARLDAGLQKSQQLRLIRQDSLFWLQPVDDPSHGYASLYRHLLNAGIYLPPSPYEVGFLSAAHSPADIDTLIEHAVRWRQP